MSFLFPDKEYNSAYDIPYEDMKADGIKALIFDLDNTVVPHGFPADDRSVKLFKHLHELGFKTCVLSNNKEKRVKPFADKVESYYVCQACKPSPEGFRTAMKLMDSTPDNTCTIGDQIFTDVRGSNSAGITSILVKPVEKDTDKWVQTKRYFERIVLFFYHINH